MVKQNRRPDAFSLRGLAPRRDGAPRDVRSELVRHYGAFLTGSGAPAAVPRLGEVPTKHTVGSMGPLQEIKMRRLRDDGLEVWTFDPRPRLIYHRQGKRLWVMGDGFRFDGEGFHPRSGTLGLERRPIEDGRGDPALRGQLREYVRTHYGLEPNEYVVGHVTRPRVLVPLGYAQSVTYRTDRNDGGSTQCHPWDHADGVNGCALRAGARDRDGMSPWEHPFEDEGADIRRTVEHTQPLLCTGVDGRGLWFCGGSYTILDGWIAG